MANILSRLTKLEKGCFFSAKTIDTGRKELYYISWLAGANQYFKAMISWG